MKPGTRGTLFKEPAIIIVRTRGEDYWLRQNNGASEGAYKKAAASFIARVTPRLPNATIGLQEAAIETINRRRSWLIRLDEDGRKFLLTALEQGEELRSLSRANYSIDSPDAKSLEGHVAMTDRRLIMFNKGLFSRNDDVTALRLADVAGVDYDEDDESSDVIIRSTTSSGYKLSYNYGENLKWLVRDIRAQLSPDGAGAGEGPGDQATAHRRGNEDYMERRLDEMSWTQRPHGDAVELLLQALQGNERVGYLAQVVYAADAKGAKKYYGHLALTDRRVIMFNKGAFSRNDDVTTTSYAEVAGVNRVPGTWDELNGVMIRRNTPPNYRIGCLEKEDAQSLLKSVRAHLVRDGTSEEETRSNLDWDVSQRDEADIESRETALPRMDGDDRAVLAYAPVSGEAEDNAGAAGDEDAALTEKRRKLNRQWKKAAPWLWDGRGYRDVRYRLAHILEDDKTSCAWWEVNGATPPKSVLSWQPAAGSYTCHRTTPDRFFTRRLCRASPPSP